LSERPFVFLGLRPGLRRADSLVLAVARQERRSELGGGAAIVAAAFALAPGAPITATLAAAFAARSAVPIATAAFTARPTIAAVTARTTVATTTATVATVTARPTVAAFTRLARGTGVGDLLAGLLVDQAHRQ